MSDFKGQISNFLKPIEIIIFVGIFLTVLSLFLNFELGLQEERAEINLQAQSIENFGFIADCISSTTVSSSDFKFEKSSLEDFEKNISSKQLPCANLYDIGYEVDVSQNYIQKIPRDLEQKVSSQVVFVLDETGSMEPSIEGVRRNSKNFIDSLEEGKVAIITYDGSNAQLVQNFTDDVDLLSDKLDNIDTTPSGSNDPTEAVNRGMKKALNLKGWKNDTSKAVVMTNTDGAKSGYNRGKNKNNCGKLDSTANKAENNGIKIYSINSFGDNSYEPSDACKQEIEEEMPNNTGGENYNLGESWNDILVSISEQVNVDNYNYGGRNTCSLPASGKENGRIEIVVVGDTSEGMSGSWDNICGNVKNGFKNLRDSNLVGETSYYVPGNPKDNIDGLGSPMNLNGEFDHKNSSTYPSCVKDSSNSALNNGVTEWDSEFMPNYDEDNDYGYEAWGAYSKWIVENHDWNDNVDERILYVVGDNIPSGGDGTGSSFKYSSDVATLDNGSKIVEETVQKANIKDIKINTIRTKDWEYEEDDVISPDGRNDAEILMERMAEGTGGNFIETGNGSLREEIEGEINSYNLVTDRANFCGEQDFEFGQEYEEPSDAVYSTITRSFPVSIIQKNEISTPGTLSIQFKDTELTRIAGKLNRVIERGKNSGDEVATSIEINNEYEINLEESRRPVYSETEYEIINRDTMDTEVNISDEIIIGVNGEKVLDVESNSIDSKIDFSKKKRRFKAYEGASIQYMLVNRKSSTGIKTEPLGLRCTSCGDTQILNLTSGIDAPQDSETYVKRGGLGVYEKGSLKLDFGENNTIEQPSVCLGSDEDVCNHFDIDSVTDISLQPGRHILKVNYNPSTNQLVVAD